MPTGRSYLTSYTVVFDQKLSVTSKWSLRKIAKVWTLTTSVTGPSRTKFLTAPLGLTLRFESILYRVPEMEHAVTDKEKKYIVVASHRSLVALKQSKRSLKLPPEKVNERVLQSCREKVANATKSVMSFSEVLNRQSFESKTAVTFLILRENYLERVNHSGRTTVRTVMHVYNLQLVETLQEMPLSFVFVFPFNFQIP